MPIYERPTRSDLDVLLLKVGPEISRRFRRCGVSETEAVLRTAEALCRLAACWDQVEDRERWLIQALRFPEHPPEPPEAEPRPWPPVRTRPTAP